MPNAVTATSEEETAFMIDIPVASISAGTIEKAAADPEEAGQRAGRKPEADDSRQVRQLILTSGSPIRDRVFSISVAITSITSANSASNFWPSSILPSSDPAKAPAIPAAANTSAQDHTTVPPRAWLERLTAALVATAIALVPIARCASGTPTT